jgi:hypothetical protein
MSAALALAVHGSSELYADSLERLAKAAGVLLDRAVAAGEIRSDISPKDLLRALVGTSNEALRTVGSDQLIWACSNGRLTEPRAHNFQKIQPRGRVVRPPAMAARRSIGLSTYGALSVPPLDA